MKNREWSRREFLSKGLAVGAAGAVAGSAGIALAAGKDQLPEAAVAPSASPLSQPGRIIQVRDERALRRLSAYPNRDRVKVMVERAVTALTGKRSAAEAWATLVSPKDLIGIKPNMLGGRYNSTHREVLEVVLEGLRAAGVPAGRIIVWEQRDKLFRRGRLRARNRRGQVRYLPIMTSYPKGYFGTRTKHGAGYSRYCEIVHKVSAIINLPVFKDHALAGITVSMKNLTHGSIDNPFEYHHKHSGEIADIYASPVLASKVRLHLADALRLQYDGGPFDTARKVLHHSIYASTDPVAIDATALRLIEDLRRRKRLRSLKRAGRSAAHVGRAQDLGLGFADEGKIKLEKIELG